MGVDSPPRLHDAPPIRAANNNMGAPTETGAATVMPTEAMGAPTTTAMTAANATGAPVETGATATDVPTETNATGAPAETGATTTAMLTETRANATGAPVGNCLVCHDDLIDPTMVTMTLVCGHVYHKYCIEQYCQVSGKTIDKACLRKCYASDVGTNDVEDLFEEEPGPVGRAESERLPDAAAAELMHAANTIIAEAVILS